MDISVYERPSWLLSLDEIENSPSRWDGISAETELMNRKSTCIRLKNVPNIFAKVPDSVIQTTFIYFNRFFSRKSLRQFDRFSVIVACLWIASKVTDFCGVPLSSRTIYDYYCQLLEKPHGYEPENKILDELACVERFVLHTLEYALDVIPPTEFVDQISKKLDMEFNSEMISNVKKLVVKTLQTTICLHFDSVQIAAGCLWLFFQKEKRSTDCLLPFISAEDAASLENMIMSQLN